MSKNLILPKKKALSVPTAFMDLEGKSGIPAATMANARVALTMLGVKVKLDIFRDRRIVAGIDVANSMSGQVLDDTILVLRQMIREQFKFDPGLNCTWDAVNLLARENAFHPIVDYFESLKWDGKPRVGTWLIDYMGSPDSEYTRAISEMSLVASVRRIKRPGTKYDYMIVLESKEGTNKSSGLATLYGRENFSDQQILGVPDKTIMENLHGKWCHESSDLDGMRRAEVSKVKAQLSRETDRARPAYGRALVEYPRTIVQWGTTNEQEYLRSQTGNRRFLPNPVGDISVEKIARDRDQLWAEACVLEDLGIDIMLPQHLWAVAGIEQAKRTESSPWLDTLQDIGERAARSARESGESDRPIYEITDDGEERLASWYIMSEGLNIPHERQSPDAGKKVRRVMEQLGWRYAPGGTRIKGEMTKGYTRLAVWA